MSLWTRILWHVISQYSNPYDGSEFDPKNLLSPQKNFNIIISTMEKVLRAPYVQKLSPRL
jgi:hypothetical protein